ncbi:cysteine--tRNA ligase [Buchnera aphidicola]|uniref:Cysteine--tRNA ligase n=1 Tax=Buchnera aphidicola subsp. Cinara cedri (strain Cc) TaxID=372461 RepID=SYC_BUCCC|nr:cysteine--tRNA ligase [Buchnera aphidicola]Q057D6.1 RecName: Full=Cysteine--tRNA ligase; AltName: Full=Cysteinyl-tRNA synthetase; Short=CysRS [Buchnera aphidicola BCc]ABJ90763.1 cysteinyl-tRNA synthetase [Buchnera aphidicola BCc]
MLRIFNTLTKKKEIFDFLLNKKINIYVCGVTTYDFCHIGHARTFIIFDIIIRYLQYLGYNTFYIRNITDIDDKIINKAKINNESIHILVNRMIKLMHKDFLSLNLIKPDQEPRVTQHISNIISSIKLLLKNNYAYVSDNKDILFKLNNFKEYGFLSNRMFNCSEKNFTTISKEKNYINNINDFVLWKHSNQLSIDTCTNWSSPWGAGRPGWHIECSSIINNFFKDGVVDIHGGGIDLLFPHHENEIAQLKSMNNSFSVNFWIHSGMVINKNHKMSKSFSNSVSIQYLLKKYDSEIIRWYFLATHYRHPLYYSEKNLLMMKNIFIKIYRSLLDCVVTINTKIDYEYHLRNKIKRKFFSAMNDDFNTPKACSILQKISKLIYKNKKNNTYLANILASDLVYLGKILGLFQNDPKNFFLKDNFCNKSTDLLIIVEKLFHMRNFYRSKKQWNLSDIIRKKLFCLGVIVEDNSYSSYYRFI